MIGEDGGDGAKFAPGIPAFWLLGVRQSQLRGTDRRSKTLEAETHALNLKSNECYDSEGGEPKKYESRGSILSHPLLVSDIWCVSACPLFRLCTATHPNFQVSWSQARADDTTQRGHNGRNKFDGGQ